MDKISVSRLFNRFNGITMAEEFLKKYQAATQKTAQSFENKTEEIMTWGLGIAGEAGDVAGCIKKTFAHGNDQTAGIKENMGDTMWYMAMICNYFGWDLKDVLNENLQKLEKRYAKGFTKEEAGRKNTRVDWNEKK